MKLVIDGHFLASVLKKVLWLTTRYWCGKI